MNKKKYKDSLYPDREVKDIKYMIYSSEELYGDRNAFLVKDNPKEGYKPVTYKWRRMK